MRQIKITKQWLENRRACHSGFRYVCEHDYIGLDIIAFLEKLMREKRLSDANWLITKYMNKKQSVLYAIFAAQQVLPFFEKKYPKNKKPRKAIEAAHKYLKQPCKRTKNAAYAAAADAAAADAAYAAYADAAAADAAYAAAYAAYAAAADAAYAAAYADAAAADAAYAAADAAAAYAAYAAYADAAAAMRIKILENGIKILKEA